MPNNKTFPTSSIRYGISVLFMGLLEYQPSNTRTCWRWDIIHWPLSVFHFPRLPIWIYLLTAWNPLLHNPRRIKTSTKSKECIKTKCKKTDPNKKKKTWKCSYLIWCLGKPKLSKLREWEMAAPTQSASALYPSYLQGFATHTPKLLIAGIETNLRRGEEIAETLRTLVSTSTRSPLTG
jgi:hypothetical protein